MIFTSKKPTSIYLSEKFDEFLAYDIVANLKDSFSIFMRRVWHL